MSSDTWTWSSLDDDQMRILDEGEKTLGADILLAFDGGQGAAGNGSKQHALEPASLDESQVECLQGLEKKLAAVVVAYDKY